MPVTPGAGARVFLSALSIARASCAAKSPPLAIYVLAIADLDACLNSTDPPSPSTAALALCGGMYFFAMHCPGLGTPALS